MSIRNDADPGMTGGNDAGDGRRIRDRRGEPDVLGALHLNELTYRLLRLFMKRFSRKDYLGDVVEILRQWSGCRCVGVRIRDAGGGIPYEAYCGFSREFWESESLLSIHSDACVCTRIVLGRPESADLPHMTRGGSFCCGDTKAFVAGLTRGDRGHYRGICVETGFVSVAVVPLRFQDRTLGAIHFADERTGAVSVPEVEAVETVAPVIAEAVQRLNMENEFRRQHRSLQEANELLESIFADMNVKIAVLDPRLRFVRVNRAYAETNLRDPEFFVGRGHFDLFPHKENEEIFRRVLATGEPHFVREKPFELPDRPDLGVTYWDWMLQAVRDADGAINGLLLILHDVTEKKMAQEQAVRQGQLACLGELAAGVAHEVNNPITGIINYAQIILDSQGKESPGGDIAGRIIKEGERVAHIVRNLLAFARDERRRRRPVKVGELLLDAFGLAARHLERDGIRLNIELPEGIPEVYVNTQEIGQVFLNLLSNARYALNRKYPGADEGKKLDIRADPASLDGTDAVRVVFEDHGTGIPRSVLGNVTKPFFTTKVRNHGTGLGLSISQRIVEEHGGRLVVRSLEGESTTVEVVLPCRKGNDA